MATLTAATLGCAERGSSRVPAPEPVVADWGAESVAWTDQFFELTGVHGGLGATPFLSPDVVLDHRSFYGEAGHQEGLDDAVMLLDWVMVGDLSTSERWSYSDVPYLDPVGVVLAAEVNLAADPDRSSLMHRAAVVMDVGRHGIERQTYLPSTRLWTDRSPAFRDVIADRAEAIATGWTAAANRADPSELADRYAADAVLMDEVVGVNVRGRSAIVDRWKVSSPATWRVADHDGVPAVYLWSPLFEETDGRIGVLAEVSVDDGDGCPGMVAVWLEVDGEDRITSERRLRSAADVSRCEPVEHQPSGWWTGRSPPADLTTGDYEDLETVTHAIVEGGLRTEIRNGTSSLAALIGWGLGRFDLAGLQVPDVKQVTFTAMSAYCEDVMGRAISLPTEDPVTGETLEGGWGIVLCLDDDDVYIDEGGAVPSPRARYVVLHELAHVWLSQHLDTTTRQYFLESIGLATWNDRDRPWAERGTEWAASFVGWGLMDTALPLYELDDPPTAMRFQGFQLLTGRQPLGSVDVGE